MPSFLPYFLSFLSLVMVAGCSSSAASGGGSAQHLASDGCPEYEPDLGSACTLTQGTSCRYNVTCESHFAICHRGAWEIEILKSNADCALPPDGGTD